MAPWWKVRRELARLGIQVQEWPQDLRNFFFDTPRYDRSLRREIRRFEGGRPATPRVAVVLIYPGTGLLPSHLHTLGYLAQKGYAPFVVSNLPLPEADRARLLPAVWRYLERPNFGYDFGGYRDGVLELADEVKRLERLLLLNDSTWFPLPNTEDWLEAVEALGVDFAGAATNYGTPRPEHESFREIVWNYRASHRNFHYCSFALCLRPTVLRHRGFLRYWQGLRLSDKKKRTVRRGEIGLSQWMLRNGFSHAATLDVRNLDRDLAALTDARLFEVARDLIIPEDPRLRALKSELLADPAVERRDLEKLVLLAVSRQGSSYALARYAISEGHPFLKKSPLWLSAEGSRISLRLLEELGPQAKEMLAEAHVLAGRLAS